MFCAPVQPGRFVIRSASPDCAAATAALPAASAATKPSAAEGGILRVLFGRTVGRTNTALELSSCD
jgi:hypothetical protein